MKSRFPQRAHHARLRNLSCSLVLALIWQALAQPVLAATRLHNVAVTPSVIVFASNDPDTPNVPGSVSATINFRTTSGITSESWRVDVQAASGANMVNCPRAVPISRIRVTCVSAVAEGGTGGCAAPFNLSTSLQTVASGTEGAGNARPYSVVVNFSFQDSWQYIATNSPCSVNLSYQIIAN